MKLLILDNYDSFTYNLYQLLGEICESTCMSRDDPGNFRIDVVRNDEASIDEIAGENYGGIIISPGPGSPSDPEYFGVCSAVISSLGSRSPILGICLGMQGIATTFGGTLTKLEHPMHGKTSLIEHDGSEIFKSIPQGAEVMRYHSLVVKRSTLPDCLTVTASTKAIFSEDVESRQRDNDVIMGLKHRTHPIYGVQYHPESFATLSGRTLLRNFLELQIPVHHSD